MAATCFEDDFHNRVRKQIQSQFRKSVIPSHLLPYLQCLAIEDEERVQAVEKNTGQTLAADELFNLIIRRTNWIEDLTRALRDPDVKLEFLADEIEKLLKEVPMRWAINGFVDNFGRACFDGNCGTVEQPMEHDEGGTVSHSAYSSPGIEKPGEEQRMELLKEQPVVGELKQEQHIEELKEIDETVPKVRTDSDDTSVASVPTEHEDNDNSIDAVSSAHKDHTQSIEERRANLKLAMMEKVWSFVNKPGDVPIALGYIDRALLQITGIDKGSLLFKVNVSTLDDLKRVQELVSYGGMKKILDKELVEKHMEIFKDLAREERLELLSVNSKLYIHQSDLERCKALLSAPKDKLLGLADIDNLPTENFQNESDILMLKQLKELLPTTMSIKMLKYPSILNRLPQFLKLHAQEVKNASKREIEPLIKHDIESMLYDIVAFTDSEKEDMLNVIVEWYERESNDVIDHTAAVKLTEREPQVLSDRQVETTDRDIQDLPAHEVNLTELEAQHVLGPVNLNNIPDLKANLTKLAPEAFLDRVIEMSNRDPCPLPFCGIEHKRKLLRFQTLLNLKMRLNDIRRRTEVKEELHVLLMKWVETDADTIIPSDVWMTDTKPATYEFLRDILSLRSLITYNKNIISIKVSSLNEIGYLKYLGSNKYFHTLLLVQENVIARKDLEVEVCVQLPGISHGLMELTEFLGVSKLATRLKMNATGIIASDLVRHLETGNFANITHFSLFDTKMNEPVSSPLGLKYMPRLQTIDMHGCDFGDAGISFIGKELGLLKELKEINVAKSGMSAEGLQNLSNGLNENHGIRALRLQNNTLGMDGAVVLAGWLKRLYLLETLNISGCGIGDIGAKYISKSFVSKVLRQLSMRENEITKEGSVIFFENMRSMKMVEHLDFGKNKIFYDSDITTLEEPVRLDMVDGQEVHLALFLQEQTHWSHLNLWACNLGAFRIFPSPEKFHAMKDLVNLCLQSNQIDDQFAGDVGACLKIYCDHIRYVNLKHNRIGNDGAIAIADGIADKKYIQELQIDRNQIEKEGVSRLLKTTLRFAHPMTLDVSCNSLAKFDIDNLQHELSLEVSTSEQDSGVEGTTRIYVPRDNEPKVKIYM